MTHPYRDAAPMPYEWPAPPPMNLSIWKLRALWFAIGALVGWGLGYWLGVA